MDPVLYNAMNGSQVNFDRQTINANNLANSNTPGFKEDLSNSQSLFITGSVAAAEALVVEQSNNTDFSDGPLMTTGRDLDVAVQGHGWFAVQDANGKEAYTRAGQFHINENGMLLTASDRPVLGDGGPVSIPPAQRVEIGTDGTISIVPLEGPPNALAVLDRLKLVKLDHQNLYKDMDGLIKLKKGGVAQEDASITVIKGALEGSNVNAVEQMVNLIAAGREFEAEMGLIRDTDERSKELARLLQL